MQFEVTILGSNAAIPAHGRFPSAQVLNYNGEVFLIDCGEGSQFRMNDFSIKRARLNNIFISHLHGDHYYGLIGLLNSFHLNWRENPLHIYGPSGLEEIVNVHLKHSRTELRYKIHFHPIVADVPTIVYDDNTLTVETIILNHRLPTTGYLFKEKKYLRKILADKILQYEIPHNLINEIKAGADFTDNTGKIIPNQELTVDSVPPRSYAYCSDTCYTENFVEQIRGVNLLYHEATFVHEHEARAMETFHTTSKQAGNIARLAEVDKLIVGHFSARYANLDTLLSETREVFADSYLAIEGTTFAIESSVAV